MEASKPVCPTQKKNGDQRGWSLGRGLLAQEGLTSIRDALKRVCVIERGCAGLRHEEWGVCVCGRDLGMQHSTEC